MINKIIHGDCLEVMKDIPDKSIDAIITDPPYGTTACKWDSVIPFEPMWEQLNRIIKPNGAIVLFGSEPFSSALRMSNIKDYKYDLIWDKNKGSQPQLANIQPMKSHENISLFGIGRITYNPQFTYSTPYIRNNKQTHGSESLSKGLKPIIQKNDGRRYPKTILLHPRDFSAQSRVHPTQKPIKLIEYLILTYTNENETVLDFTIGSGTTAVACINTNRNFIGIEQEQKYVDIANNRIKEALEHRTTATIGH